MKIILLIDSENEKQRGNKYESTYQHQHSILESFYLLLLLVRNSFKSLKNLVTG